MKKLNKEEYEILYFISRGRNSIERLEEIFEKESIQKTIKELEKMKLIKISYRDEKPYGFMETQKGEALLNSQEYSDWFNECGD